jgi:hypothetical protein
MEGGSGRHGDGGRWAGRGTRKGLAGPGAGKGTGHHVEPGPEVC